MQSLFVQWLLRILGYAGAAGATYVGNKYGDGIGAAVGTAGGYLLNKATQRLIPKKPPAPLR